MFYRLILAVVLGIIAYYFGEGIFNANSKPKITFDDLPQEMKKWHGMGRYTTVHGRKMFYIYQKCSNSKLENPPTFAIIHGFPSSSYEYHRVLQKLANYGNVVLNDHIGFGFSEAPTEGYTYSLGEAAENLLALWRYLGIKKAHIVSHDMGDSILTEILARRYRKMLPNYFDAFFQSVTFTNGGMNFKLINFRISQLVMMYPKVAKPLIYITGKLGVHERVFKQQIRGIWGPVLDSSVREKDIDHLYMLNVYNGFSTNSYNVIYYLWDRSNFEFRWFDALKKLDIPSRFIWGDSDAVSPVAIPKTFEKMIPGFDLTIVKNHGHFWMLEDPEKWVNEIVKIIPK